MISKTKVNDKLPLSETNMVMLQMHEKLLLKEAENLMTSN